MKIFKEKVGIFLRNNNISLPKEVIENIAEGLGRGLGNSILFSYELTILDSLYPSMRLYKLNKNKKNKKIPIRHVCIDFAGNPLSLHEYCKCGIDLVDILMDTDGRGQIKYLEKTENHNCKIDQSSFPPMLDLKYFFWGGFEIKQIKEAPNKTLLPKEYLSFGPQFD